MYYQKKQNKLSKQVSYLILAIIFIVFMVTIGFKLVINSVLFIIDLSSILRGSSPTLNNEYNLFIEPKIDNYFEATNSARTKISGIASKDSIVDIFVNDDKQSQSIAIDGRFDFEVSLDRTDNKIYITSTDKQTQKKLVSDTYNIRYLNNNPTLNINTPQDGDIVYQDNVTIEGATDIEVNVKVNGNPIVVDSQGKFSKNISLISGENNIEIIAEDIAGNKSVSNTKITYQAD